MLSGSPFYRDSAKQLHILILCEHEVYRPPTAADSMFKGFSIFKNRSCTLELSPEYAEAELIDGFFEREVELGSAGRNSKTDLMVVPAWEVNSALSPSREKSKSR